MHFVDKNSVPAPKALINFKKKETEKWCQYIKKERISKPSQKWRNTEIIEPLAALFRHNCGYCGYGTDKKYPPVRNEGEIDHYNQSTDFKLLITHLLKD